MDQLYRLSDILSPAVDALLGDLTGDRRAARERYANNGRYADLLRGWAGQAALVRARLAKEMRATRLDQCSGQELKDLAKSEYFAELSSAPQKAVGDLILRRTITNTNGSTTGNFAAGVIPAGTKIKRPAAPTALIPVKDAEYQTLAPIVCGRDDTSSVQNIGGGNFIHTQDVSTDVEAIREGAHANVALYLGIDQSPASVSGSLFDKFTVQWLVAAGGTAGAVDDQIRALARAMTTGSWGPTQDSVIAGALTNPGARRVAYTESPISAVGRLFVADESWAGSNLYRSRILTTLKGGEPGSGLPTWIGWGCRIQTSHVFNHAIAVAPKVILRRPQDLTNQADITTNVTAALVKYFDERPDWWTWTLNAIGAVVGGADDRILACTAVRVTEASNGGLIAAVDEAGTVTGAEPPADVDPSEFGYAVHFAVVGNAVNPTYATPGGG